MDLSLASSFRYRRDEVAAVAQDHLENVAAIVVKNEAKIFVHYDTKQIKENIGGEKKLVERLAVVVSSPVLERDVLLCAFPLESGTGEAMADAVYAILCSVELQDHVGGIVADTTASNFGPYRGSITILQEYLGYPVLVIPCQHHTYELPAKHVTRLVSGKRTTGVGETIFITYKNNYNELKNILEDSTVPLKTFDLARSVIIWAEKALQEDTFDRGDYRYSVKLLLKFLGIHLPGFSFERPKDTSPARFLIYGIFYLEITLTMNNALAYELYSGAEREKVILMAMFSACFYLPNMLKAKFPAQIPTLTTEFVFELRKLKEVHKDIADCALEVMSRHLEPVSGELAILGIADKTLSDEEREEVGKKLLRLSQIPGCWEPGNMEILPVKVPNITKEERYWQDDQFPALATFINRRSFLLLDHLSWKKEDLKVFDSPFPEWHENHKFKELCKVIEGMQVVNDNAERTIKMIKDYIKTTKSEQGLQNILLAVDVMRERSGRFKASNFTNAKLSKAIDGMLELS